ncbi:unnamed protein product [Sphagnum balticum]
MTKVLSKYIREDLEAKLLHMTEFITRALGEEWLSRVDPIMKVIRTKEAEEENERRIKEYIVTIFPAWDTLSLTMPAYYDSMDEWIKKNHALLMDKPCACDGCKKPEANA